MIQLKKNTEAAERSSRIESNIARIAQIFDLMEKPDLDAFHDALCNAGPMSGVLAQYAEQAPIPMWLKSREGKMLWFNDAYTKIYGDMASVENYIGNSDRSAWDEKSALGFDENDRKVIETMQPQICIEKLFNSRTNEEEHLQVVKWPVAMDNNVAVGIAGIAMGFYRMAADER